MKSKFLIWGFVVVLTAGILAGCGKKDDEGPQFSDDDLLKRGQAGHDAGAKGPAGPPAGANVPGSPDQLKGGRH